MNHTEAGVDHTAGETVELPDESADYVCAAVIQTRIEDREEASIFTQKIETDE